METDLSALVYVLILAILVGKFFTSGLCGGGTCG
jgi:hypothetical protein